MGDTYTDKHKAQSVLTPLPTQPPHQPQNTQPQPQALPTALSGLPVLSSAVLPPNATPKKQLTSMKQSYICCNRFLLLHKLGKGGFGLIYSGVDMVTSTEVAIKLEDVTRAKKKYLKQEFQIYQRYHSDWTYLPFTQKVALPTVYYYGRDGGYRVLVMDLLGPSLSELFTFQYEKFSLKTVCMLAIKMITAVEHLHAKGLLHRDIKPGNFVMGRGIHGNDLYLIDYGLASPYIDERGEHIPYSNNAMFHGTDKYASINNHKKIQPGRRDDLESLGYLLVYFLTGNLPWSRKNPRVKKKHRRSVYGKSKKETTIEELSQGCPNQFVKFFKHVSQLYFADKPNYDLYRQLFLEALHENGHEYDNVFDWTMPLQSGPPVSLPPPSSSSSLSATTSSSTGPGTITTSSTFSSNPNSNTITTSATFAPQNS